MNNKYLIGIIIGLLAIILLQRTCTEDTIPSKPLTSDVDTVYLTKDTVIYKPTLLVKRDTVFRPGDSIFIPDTDYHRLKHQYETLAKSYSVRNIYRDTLKLDTLGTLVILDTVQYNQLKQHGYHLSYKLPVVTKTIVPEPKRQLYVGGGISTDLAVNNTSLQLGLLYKNKKDQLFGVYTIADGKSHLQLGLSTYWKISIKK